MRSVEIEAKGTAAHGSSPLANLLLDDIEGAYQAWFASNSAAVVLVRPDFSICAAVSDPDDASEMLEALVPALGG